MAENKNIPDSIKNSSRNRLDRLYLRLLGNSRDILYLINARTGKFEYISPALTATLGFVPEEIAAMGADGINNMTHPDDRQTMIKLTQLLTPDKVVFQEVPSNVGLRLKHKTGHYVWLGINRNFVTNDKGEVEAVVGNVRDITETKLLQQQLEQALDNYKSLYHNARVALYRTRISDGKLLECNDVLAKFLGYESREKCLAEYYSAKYYTDIKRRDELMRILKEKGQVDNFDLQARRISGEIFWLRLSSRIYPEKGYIEGAAWDITASKILTRAENEILELVIQGKSSKEIAFQLKRSIRTIEDHRAHIMQKLGVHNLVELTKKVMESEGGDMRKNREK